MQPELQPGQAGIDQNVADEAFESIPSVYLGV